MSYSNALFVINAYKEQDTWYFDDDLRNIKREPFVLGASELITMLAGSRRRKAKLTFSETPIPGAVVHLTVTEKLYDSNGSGEATSAWYTDQQGNRCWLCPAQMAFFGKVADNIYALVE